MEVGNLRIAPVDIRNQQFKRVVRGADPEEVRIFLGLVADEMEKLISDERELEQKVAGLEAQVDEYRKVEIALRDTLLTAERVSSEARENSRKEAELLLRDAELKAERILDDASRRASELRREIVDLKNQKDIYIARLRSLVETQLKMLRFHSVDMEEQEEAITRLTESQRALRLDLEEPGTRAKPVPEEEQVPVEAGSQRQEDKAPPEDVPYVEVRTTEGD
jgi:cell division initiation protein